MGNSSSSADTGDARGPAKPKSMIAKRGQPPVVQRASYHFATIGQQVDVHVTKTEKRLIAYTSRDGVLVPEGYGVYFFTCEFNYVRNFFVTARRLLRDNDTKSNRAALQSATKIIAGRLHRAVLAHVNQAVDRVRDGVANYALIMHDVQIAQKLAVYASFTKNMGVDAYYSEARDAYMPAVEALCSWLNDRMTRNYDMEQWAAAIAALQSALQAINYFSQQYERVYNRFHYVGADKDKTAKAWQAAVSEIAVAKSTGGKTLLTNAMFAYEKTAEIQAILLLYKLRDPETAERYSLTAKKLRFYAMLYAKPYTIDNMYDYSRGAYAAARELRAAGIRVANLRFEEKDERKALGKALARAGLYVPIAPK